MTSTSVAQAAGAPGINTDPPLDDSPSILLLILDIHPLSWSLSANPPSKTEAPTVTSTGSSSLSFDRALNDLLVFMNSHLALKYGNELVVYIAMEGGRSELVYSSHQQKNPHHPSAIEGAFSSSITAPLPPNSFQPFHSMQEIFRSRIRAIFDSSSQAASNTDTSQKESWQSQGPAIVPALLQALCHINRLHPSHQSSHSISNLQSSTTGHHLTDSSAEDGGAGSGPGELKARIMIVNNTPDRGSGGYVGLMNAVFAAQKKRTPIDVLNLHSTDSIFLQQASHLTHGLYYRLPKRDSLLMYLNIIFLPPPSLRSHLGLPSQDKVDFRAVCFCHQRVVDIGFVCSVCLSIFCAPTPICRTCKSRFPISSIQQLKKALPAAAAAQNTNGQLTFSSPSRSHGTGAGAGAGVTPDQGRKNQNANQPVVPSPLAMSTS